MQRESTASDQDPGLVSGGALTEIQEHVADEEVVDERTVQWAVREALIRFENTLPPPDQSQTLRHVIENSGTGTIALMRLRLACFFFDSMEIKFFALWDVSKKRVAYRTRNGFSVYARRDNPAGRMISTRPMERDAGSQQTFQRMKVHLNECLYGERRGKKMHSICPLPAQDYMPTRLLEICGSNNSFKIRLRSTAEMPVEPYIALSYCWGGDQRMKSTCDQLDTWMSDIPWDALSQTLRDAIVVCHNLLFRLLWVDAFCIVQDDPQDKAVEIAQMPNVYRNSVITIAASRAQSVQEGFLAERISTQLLDQVFQLPFKGRYFSEGAITLFRTKIEPEPLDTRGWSLQERLLSPRTYEFGTRQSRFICQHNPRGVPDGWRVKPEEHGSRQDNLDDVAVLQTQFIGAQQPQGSIIGTDFEEAMENWYHLVGVYSYRRLTFSTDRIMAISGIAARYGHIFGDEYCAGLWRSTFSRALYWKVRYSEDETYPRPTSWQGPFWSWISINWPVSFPSPDETDEVEPRVLHINLQLANPADPYGALLTGSGHLTVRGKINAAYLMLEKSPFGIWRGKAGGMA
ncbi:HET-domain-containing protein [Trematosphaeria pertusa]|uniref:HET-domain-containing protein n=1 Tax=Trematosphaeria pertusa TaxID=390896 RepID=A0A6A6IKJ8_9PLEO|nr:HET-domain-containing protein [Trematosphaeria pertusa]KAF2251144.1 HET-domain-containing protein [Trematosphaeria pertusa]